jgi:hypothetical protein
MARRKSSGNKIAIKGFFRLQIKDKQTGKVVGDTGYIENQITNYGMANCFVGGPAAAADSVQINGAVLGSGTDPASNATALDGSLGTDYYSTVAEAINGSTQAQFTQSYDNSYGAITLANIGLLAANTGSLIAGKTFASSAVATTQDINLTYNINYATS